MGISAKQFAAIEERLKAHGRAKPIIADPVSSVVGPARLTILGVDPSLRGTGWGVISLQGTKAAFIGCGTIHCPRDWRRSRCLLEIGRTIREIVQAHAPNLCVVEGLFFAQNHRTTLVLGEARGSALAVMAEHGLDIYEVAPRRVKQAIAGYGAAHKIAVARMVQNLLELAALPAPDAADALAVALAFAQARHRQLSRETAAPL